MSAPTKPKKSILMVDDEDNLELIQHIFGESERFELDVDLVTIQHPDRIPDALMHPIGAKAYDVYVVDLQLIGPQPPSLWLGNVVIEALAWEHPGVPIVVFSAHDELPDILHAMRRGARDFVPKGEHGYQELLRVVESWLRDAEIQELEWQKAEELIQQSGAPLPDPFHKFVIISGGEPRVRGRTLLEALWKYRNMRSMNPELSDKPVIVPLPVLQPSQVREDDRWPSE
jgi:DNA-binding NarL/FixJ family response regulator